ncbi:DinB family protein [Paenibacillus spiritus]|uniref:DinB family protein n=1 Tax=Paenibacillus spiritus TaxID=2496557 RepID=A0A5J5GD52_9BACL|nr:DinB family protein [Paenibacillus spiritus]KAA9005880.1 DinB family protein [Paenibacillus spiritus]
MDTKETLRQFEETVRGYIRDLESSSLERLLWKPSEDEWSLGQMYMHLIRSAQFMQLRNAALCLEPGESTEVSQTGKTKAGEEVFKAGSFPPDRVHVPPSPQYTPPQPESKGQLAEGLRDTLRRMEEIESRITAELDSGKEAAPYTVLHPRFGGLNALEWFRLTEMHYRHHLLQKGRLDDAWREAH